MAATIEHPTVKLWRDLMLLNASAGRKKDIELTIGPDGEEGLKLWREILEGWWFMKNGKKKWKNRWAIGAQLAEYEERRRG